MISNDQQTKWITEEVVLPEVDKPKVKTSVVGSYVGLFWCIFHVFLLACASTLVKFIQVPAETKLFIRSCIQFFILLPPVQYMATKKSLDLFGGSGKSSLYPLLCRGLLGPVGSLCLYQALDRIPLGDTVSLTFASTIFAGILGRIFLKEAYVLLDFAFSLLSLSGVVLIAKPAFLFGDNEQNYGLYELGGVGLALLNALLVAACLVLIRHLGKTKPILNVFYFSWMGSLIGGTFVFALGNFYIPCIWDLLQTFCIGLIGMSSQLAVTKALQTERATTVAIIRSLQLIIVFVFQIFLFGDMPNALSIGGAFLLLASALGVTIRKCYQENQQASAINS